MMRAASTASASHYDEIGPAGSGIYYRDMADRFGTGSSCLGHLWPWIGILHEIIQGNSFIGGDFLFKYAFVEKWRRWRATKPKCD